MEIAKSGGGLNNREMASPAKRERYQEGGERSERYWFYVPNLRKEGEAPRVGNTPARVHLPEDQGHHAANVLRLETGVAVVLFDGNGASAGAKITAVTRRGEVEAELEDEVHVDAPPALRLTIATAVPKGERAEWLIEQASQLNVTAIQWLAAERGVVKPREGGGKMEKWRRLAIESAKQCGRTHIMRVQEPARLEDVLEESRKRGARLLWLEPRGGESTAGVRIEPGEIVALVGPEGGWSERETEALERRAEAGEVRRIWLTKTILRIETACAAVAAVLMSQ